MDAASEDSPEGLRRHEFRLDRAYCRALCVEIRGLSQDLALFLAVARRISVMENQHRNARSWFVDSGSRFAMILAFSSFFSGIRSRLH